MAKPSLSLLGVLFALANLLACLGFVFSRPPVDNVYLNELDRAKGLGHITGNSAIAGIMACRIVVPWGTWHGQEKWYVKALQLFNIDIVIPLLFLSAILSAFAILSTCVQSWMIGIIFAACAMTQWYFIGSALQQIVRRRTA